MREAWFDRLLVVTHVPHYQYEGKTYAYGPYTREINIWCDLFRQTVIAAPVRFGRPGGDCLPVHAQAKLEHLPESGGKGVLAKLRQITLLPLMAAKLLRLSRSADLMHIRCPGNLGFVGILIAPFTKHRRIAKYAGQWTPIPGEGLSVRFQRLLLQSRWWNAPILAYTSGSTEKSSSVVPFTGAGLSEMEVAVARAAAARRGHTAPQRVLYVGRLSKAKNVDVLLKSIANLAERGIALECEIVGDGPERDSLQKNALSLGVSAKVSFTGGITPSDVLERYARADVLVLASDTEGWPKALMEGMAFGLVCIGSDHGLSAEMLADGRGFLVPPRDSAALTNALLSVLAMQPADTQQMRNRAATWAQRYTLEQFRDSLVRVLKTTRGNTEPGRHAARVGVNA